MPHRHPIPAVIEPADDISVCVPIPNHPDYVSAFLFVLRQLTNDRHWQHTPDLEAQTVRQQWMQRTLKPVLEQLADGVWCGDSDDCIEYPPNNDEIISYAPQDPFTQAGHKPNGYLFPPFTRFADIVPAFLPDWFAGLLVSFAEGLTGYDANDVLVTIGSIPLQADFDDLLADGLPRITINVSGKGRLLLHLLNVPFGGRALISVDVEFNPIDIIEGLFTDGFRLVELERDFSSAPPELDVDHIEEIELEDEGAHTIYITFLPVLNDSLVPINYGGGLRKIEFCGRDVTDVMIDCEYIQDCFDTNPDNVAFQNITVTQMAGTTEQFLQELEDMYVDSPQDINTAIPDSTPIASERNALCHAIKAWLNLYVEAKKTAIRQASFLSQAWNALQNAIVGAYGVLNNIVGFIVPDNLFSCFVSNSEALDALSDQQAIDDLACCIYDELSGITLVQGSLSGALAACAPSDLICLIQNDMNLQHELNFFYIYGRMLERQSSGENLGLCDCEAWQWTYIEYDFTLSNHGFTTFNGRGTWQAGQGWVGANQSPQPQNFDRLFVEIGKQLGSQNYKIGAMGIHTQRLNQGSGGTMRAFWGDGVTAFGRQVSPAPSGDVYRTYSDAQFLSNQIYALSQSADEPVASGATLNVKKIRIWLAPDSPVRGIPSDAVPVGLAVNGSADMSFWA